MANIRFLNRGAKRGEIWLYDQIGEGWFGGMSAKAFAEALNGLGRVDQLDLHINSEGGDVFDGLAIYNTLKRHPARVVVDIDGLAASIASVIAMAGDEIRIAENAMVMIHNPIGGVFGGSGDMRKMADTLDQVKGNLVATYERRTKQSADDIGMWMDNETWLTAADAVQRGFADAVTDPLRVAACYNLSRFNNVPSSLRTASVAQSSPASSNMAAVRHAEMTRRLRAQHLNATRPTRP